MRKILWMILVLVPVGVYGEQMNFLTTLSSPEGVFHSLDVTDLGTTADPAPTVVQRINFGAPLQNDSLRGKIYIYGKESPYFEDIEIEKNSVMEGTGVKEFRSHNIANFAPGIIMGKNLLVDQIYTTTSTDLNGYTGESADRQLNRNYLIEKLDKIHLNVKGALYTHKLSVFGLQAENLCFVDATIENNQWKYKGGSKIRYGKDDSHPDGDSGSIAPGSPTGPHNHLYNFKWTNKYQLQYFGATTNKDGQPRFYWCSDYTESGKGSQPDLKCILRTPIKVYYDDTKLINGIEKYRVPYCPLVNYEHGMRNGGCGYPEDVYLLAGQECEGGMFAIDDCAWY